MNKYKLDQNKLILAFLIKTLIKKDSSLMRKSIYNSLLESKPLIKLLIKFYQVSPKALKILYLFIYHLNTLGRIPPLHPSTKDILIYEHPNELKALKDFFPEIKNQINLKFHYTSFFRNIFMLTYSDLRRLIKLMAYISEHYPFLHSLRVSELLVFRAYFIKHQYTNTHFYLSSDGAPFSLALSSIVKNKIHYTPHGVIPRCHHILLYDYYYFDFQYNLEHFKNRFSGEIRYAPPPMKLPTFSIIQPTKKSLKVGIVGSISPRKDKIIKIAYELTQQGHTVYLKPHPNSQVIFSQNSLYTIVNSLKDTDVCLCGNSGHLIKLLANGIMTYYESSIDKAPYDIYNFVKKGIVLSFQGKADMLALSQFYNSKAWRESWKKI